MVCWAANVLWAPGVEYTAVKVAPIPGVKVRNDGIVAAGWVAVSLGEGVIVAVSVAAGNGVTDACKTGDSVAETTWAGAMDRGIAPQADENNKNENTSRNFLTRPIFLLPLLTLPLMIFPKN
jgi:hypothetical protein